jgi:uncharacterized membrane protein
LNLFFFFREYITTNIKWQKHQYHLAVASALSAVIAVVVTSALGAVIGAVVANKFI